MIISAWRFDNSMTQNSILETSAAKAPPIDPTQGLKGKVFAYIGDNSKGSAFAQHADGAVFRGAAGFKEARECADGIFRIVDSELYVNDRDNRAGSPLMAMSASESVHSQLGAGARCLFAPSRFPTDRSGKSISAILNQGQEFVDAAQRLAPSLPVFVPIVVRFDELMDSRWVRPIAASGLPIATVFAGFGDPLSSPAALEGAINVIEAAEVAFAIRGDTSVVGLMTLKAIAGAIGTSSAVRHLWLPSRRLGRKRKHPDRSIFVPAAANWMKLSFVRQALAEPRLDDLFSCHCRICGPNGDIRNLGTSDDDVQDRHSIDAAYRLARQVLGAAHPVSRWQEVCLMAEDTYAELKARGISGPTMPESLRSWHRLLAQRP